MNNMYVVSVGLSFSFLGIVLYFIRYGKMKVQYSLLWVFFSVFMFIFSFNPSLLSRLATLIEIYYAPSLLFLMGIIFSLALILHLTVIVSKLSERVIRLTQELVILKNETGIQTIPIEEKISLNNEKLFDKESLRKTI